MLRQVHVEGFKTFLEADFELGRLNVFIGPNGAGKSNILEALGVLGAAASGRVDDAALLRRGVRPGLPALYKSSFKGQRHRRFITLSADGREGGRSALYRVGLTNPIDAPLPTWEYETETVESDDESVITRSRRGAGTFPQGIELKLRPDTGLAGLARGAVPEGAREFLDRLAGFAIYSPTTPILRAIAPDPAPAAPVGLHGGNLAGAVYQLLRESPDKSWRREILESVGMLDWVDRVTASSPQEAPVSPSVPTAKTILKFTDRFMSEKRNTLSGYDASEGALYLLFMLVLAAHPEAPKSFAIDNFDQGLNPRLAKATTEQFANLLRKTNRQALLTTHNPLVLDGLDLKDDEVRLFVVKRTRDGDSKIDRVQPDMDLLQSSGMPLSRLWLSGRIGGLPEF